ncbi:helix-turn-helix domain-containing protein [Alteribacillus iranensis]|uniref:DNA-binding transcriptional regulator, MerR family n=1 Tax=Alteribacillus iranensis TaxID=930128 RepID=A0A1I1ZW19_9BACI|nr:helix-turn-helix domain-containing protein [Alteribacillus iranensis]SFE34740.1 DNA-binding transcriptional regulator, MerR family [Alteribacillus iranensis]
MDKVWYKTKDVAQYFNVSPGTVLNWVRKFEVPYSVNANGHYYFQEDQLKQFSEIKQHMQENMENNKKTTNVASHIAINRLDEVEEKIEILEKLIANKADEIIGFQLMEQRREVRELNKKLEKIEARLDDLESEREEGGDRKKKQKESSKKDKHFLAGIFSV